MTILHIDDDAGIRFLLRELATEGSPDGCYRWLEASGVEEALRLHRPERPDCILLDHRLGREEGARLVAALRSAWKCPIWLLTGVCQAGVVRRALAAGAAGVVTKDELLTSAPFTQAFLARAGGDRSAASGETCRS
jgi:CheY-like chemotaxis protein